MCLVLPPYISAPQKIWLVLHFTSLHLNDVFGDPSYNFAPTGLGLLFFCRVFILIVVASAISTVFVDICFVHAISPSLFLVRATFFGI